MTLTNEAKSTAKVFETVPDILVQDPVRDRWFLVPGTGLSKYETSVSSWDAIGPNTVTFVIPDESVFSEVPPFTQGTDDLPSVLIQWPKGKASFLMDYDDLTKFEVEERRTAKLNYGISFIIPRGTELIDELPTLRAALLQSGENPHLW